jgi:hypothetical protein
MQAMGVVNVKMPAVQLGIATGSIPATEEKEFGGILVQLGNLIQEHANKRVALGNLIIRLGEDEET